MHLCPPIERLGWRRDFHLMHLWKQMKPHMDKTKDNCKQRKAGKSRKHGFILLISLGIETFCHQKNFLGSNFELSTRFAILQNATRHSSRCYNLRINTSNQTKMIGFLVVHKKKHWIWVRIWFGLGLPSRNAYAPYTASKLEVLIWFPYHFSPYHYWISNADITKKNERNHKKSRCLEFIGIHFPTFPIFTQKNMDYLSSQASLASFLLHGHMQITRRCNLENHVTGCSFWSMFNGRISQKKKTGTKLTSWLKT